MSESYSIVAQAKGEPLPAGRVGVRVKVQLSGSPTARWSQSLSGHLVNELTGHAAVGHLRLNNIVHGDHIVLDGVEEREAPQLGPVLRRAVEATNNSCSRADARQAGGANVGRTEASAIAHQIQPST
jgi:hypothetical protein